MYRNMSQYLGYQITPKEKREGLLVIFADILPQQFNSYLAALFGLNEMEAYYTYYYENFNFNNTRGSPIHFT